MINRILFSLITLFAPICLEAAMVRVVGVADAQTLVIDRAGVAVNIKLAGITVTDHEGARSLLRWTVGSSWVMLDEQPDGGHFVYRSPDALFINRELVARGFARATLQAIEPETHVVVTYLGTMFAPDINRRPPARNPTASGTGNARSSRSPARPSPSRRRRKP
jgi:hypothetical protein